jgi:hypothetical protein
MQSPLFWNTISSINRKLRNTWQHGGLRKSASKLSKTTPSKAVVAYFTFESRQITASYKLHSQFGSADPRLAQRQHPYLTNPAVLLRLMLDLDD